MGVRFRKSWRTLLRGPLIDRSVMPEIGTFVVQQIRTRTEAGRDVRGYPFRALSQEYRARKQEALGSGDPDLTVSGRMLNALQVTQVSARQVTVGFADTGSSGRVTGTFIQRSRAVSATDKARWHNTDGAGRSRVIREFLGLSQADLRRVEQLVLASIDRALEG